MATSRKFDKLYKAIGKGERTSKKFATIRMTDGTSFKRRNANQFYPDGVPGDEDYTEKRINRTDKYTKDGKVIAKVGANIGNKKIYEELYSSPRKLLVKELIEDLGGGSIVINSNGDTRRFSKSITKNNSKYYAIFPAKSLTGKEESSLFEENGDLLVFRNKFATKEELLKKLSSVYGVNNKMASGGGIGNRRMDKMYKAIGKGERTSKKFATIRMTDGSTFKRRNANQYYPDGVPGDEDYTEKRINRTDKYTKDGKVIASKGTTISSKKKKKKTTKPKEPMIVRTQFEEENYEYGNGGTMPCCYTIGGL